MLLSFYIEYRCLKHVVSFAALDWQSTINVTTGRCTVTAGSSWLFLSCLQIPLNALSVSLQTKLTARNSQLSTSTLSEPGFRTSSGSCLPVVWATSRRSSAGSTDHEVHVGDTRGAIPTCIDAPNQCCRHKILWGIRGRHTFCKKAAPLLCTHLRTFA